jgi:hypothetical protein
LLHQLGRMEEDLEALRLSRRLRLCAREDKEARAALELWMGQRAHLAVSDAIRAIPEVMWSLSEAEAVSAREGPIHALEALREVAFAPHAPLKEVSAKLRELGARLQAEGLWALGAELVAVGELLDAARACRKLGQRFVARLNEAHAALGPVVQTLLEETQMALAAQALGLRCTLWQHEADIGHASQEASQLRCSIAGLGLEASSSLDKRFVEVKVGLEAAREAEVELRETEEGIMKGAVELARARKTAMASVEQIVDSLVEEPALKLEVEQPPGGGFNAPNNDSALGFIRNLEEQAGRLGSRMESESPPYRRKSLG